MLRLSIPSIISVAHEVVCGMLKVNTQLFIKKVQIQQNANTHLFKKHKQWKYKSYTNLFKKAQIQFPFQIQQPNSVHISILDTTDRLLRCGWIEEAPSRTWWPKPNRQWTPFNGSIHFPQVKLWCASSLVKLISRHFSNLKKLEKENFDRLTWNSLTRYLNQTKHLNLLSHAPQDDIHGLIFSMWFVKKQEQSMLAISHDQRPQIRLVFLNHSLIYT